MGNKQVISGCRDRFESGVKFFRAIFKFQFFFCNSEQSNSSASLKKSILVYAIL